MNLLFKTFDLVFHLLLDLFHDDSGLILRVAIAVFLPAAIKLKIFGVE